MEFVSDSETAVFLAWSIGAASLALCAALTVYAFFLRVLHVRRNRRAENFQRVWEGLIAESLDRLPENLPRVKKRDAISFLKLWNHLQESLRAESKEQLNRLAREIDIDVIALDLLERGSLDERLLAVNTLGWLRHDTNWEKLVGAARSDDPIYSLAAAKALMRIDAAKAIRELMPLFARRADWSTTTVGAILREAGADLISEPLARAVLLAPPDQTARLVRFLEIAHAETAVPIVKRVLRDAGETETVTACLRVFQDAEDLETVRRLLRDERWQVRLQAAACLGRIGTAEDEPRLLAATRDEAWWVRYRAAQALASLPSMTEERLAEMAAGQTGAAGDIIRQVIAEKHVLEI